MLRSDSASTFIAGEVFNSWEALDTNSFLALSRFSSFSLMMLKASPAAGTRRRPGCSPADADALAHLGDHRCQVFDGMGDKTG